MPDGGPLPGGTLVDNFRLTRPIARGGMGEVYLARDTRLGRRVALKIIRTEHEHSEDATRSLLFEAQTIARFSHPNIVTVFAVGEFEGRPYLALEYLEGDNLEERLEERTPSLSESLRIAHSICDAVAEAHEHGVLHLDLKPANVIIPRDGRLRVLDFGLAKIVRDNPGAGDGQATVGWGTPAYTAPEQWRRQATTGATDVWSLGVMMYEMLSGQLPWSNPSPVEMGRAICSEDDAPRLSAVADVPPETDELVARCLAKDPEARPTAKEVGEILLELLGGGGTVSMEENPFRGLLPFTSRHAGLFFGREAEVAAFLERARHHGVLPIVGQSGAGKSSFVQAGVIPRLREQGDWVVLQLRPGARPFETLVDRLRRRDAPKTALTSDADGWSPSPSASQVGIIESARVTPTPGLTFEEDPAEVVQQLMETPRKLALLLRRLADETGRNVLLVVEQLEQLITMVDDARTRRRFVSALCTAADDALEPVRVVFTVRDDALGRIATGPEVRDALANMTVLQNLERRSLRKALRKPVEALGYRYEDEELVERMVEAVRGEPGSLPLLQFAAAKLWDQRDTDRRLLLTSTYEAMGGVEGALARHADEVVDGLSDHERRLARSVLIRLVTADRRRRAIPVTEAHEGLPDPVEEVIDRLAQARLVTMTRGKDTAGPRVELSHESLVSRWDTLVRWLDEARGDALFLAEARPAAELWERRGRRPEELWRGDALQEAVRRRSRLRSDPPPLVDEFLEAAQFRQRRREQRRRNSVIAVVAVSLVLAAAAVTAALVIADKERSALEARDQAEHQQAVALREAATAAASAGHLLEARAKLRVALTAEDAPLARALWRDLRDEPRVWHHQLGSLVHEVAFSPDGAKVAAGCQDTSVYVIDIVTREVEILRGSGDQVNAVGWAPDGKTLASGGWNGNVVVWDRETHRPRHTLSDAHEGSVLAVTHSPDGKWLATGGADEVVRLWDPETGEAQGRLDAGDAANGLAFSNDSKTLAVATGDGVLVWSVPNGQPQRLGEGTARAVEFSPDARWLAAAFDDATARVWKAKSLEPVATLQGHGAGVNDITFDVTGDRLITASSDKTVRLWRVANAELLRSLDAHDAGVTSLALEPGGQRLATASRDRSVRLWNLERERVRDEERGHTAGVYRVAFTPDGRTVVSGAGDKTIRLWDVASGEQTAVLRGHTEGVDSVAVSPDGTLMASGSIDMSVRLWDLESATERKVLTGHSGRVFDVAFSEDGEFLASGGRDGIVRVWDAETGAEVGVFDEHDGSVFGVAFAPDGGALASAGADGTIRLWPFEDDRPARVLVGHEGSVYGLGFIDDGRRLVSAGADRTVGVWDLRGGGWQQLGPHGGRGYWLGVDAERGVAAVPASDGTVTVWSIEDGRRQAVLEGHRDEANTAALSPDGSLVATAADDGTVRLWESATGRPFWRAPIMLLGPPLLYSHEGWVPLEPAAVEDGPRAAQWADAVEQEVRRGSYHRSGRACVVTHGGRLELWSVADGQRLAVTQQPQVADVRAAAHGCLGRTDEGAVWLAEDGSVRALATEAPVRAIDIAEDGGEGRLVIATNNELIAEGADESARTTRPIEPGATAVTRVEGGFVLGFADGNIRRLVDDDSDRAQFFEDVPASAVERLIPGPPGTVVAGYANGSIGMWSTDTGSQLALGRLHGRVVHLAVEKGFLYAATDLGHALRWDLDVLVADYCAVLREVWDQVPVIWTEGRVVVEEPPTDHECASR